MRNAHNKNGGITMNKFMKKMLILVIVVCLIVSFAVLAVGC